MPYVCACWGSETGHNDCMTIPWRYALFLILCLSGVILVAWLPWYHGVMAGFDIAAIGYMLTLPALFRDNGDDMRERVQRNDGNLVLLLVLTGIIMLAILTSVGAEFFYKAMNDTLSIGFTIFTLMLAWVFSNLIYALHYAHLYYQKAEGGHRGGLHFPVTKSPHYWDFIYFAFGLGMAFQTSDVEITDTQLRIVATIHAAAAFFFNIGAVAVSINILAGQ